MEKKTLTNRYLPFLSGTLFGVLILGVFLMISGSRPPEPSAPSGSLSLSTAKSYFHQYLSGSPLRIDTLKGIGIDLDQLNAMKSIMAGNSRLKGCRIYFGLDNSSNRVGIIVGIDNQGHDDLTTISLTTRSYDPCPPICDATTALN